MMPVLSSDSDTQGLDSSIPSADPQLLIDLMGQHMPDDGKLYMIIDAACDERIYAELVASRRPYSSLYGGPVTADSLRAVSPYLTKIDQADDFVRWCFRHGLMRHWMTFFTVANKSRIELRVHFKRFALVETEQGQRLIFRYYDPRVLSAYLPTCNETELEYVFKDIPCFWLPLVSTNLLDSPGDDIDKHVLEGCTLVQYNNDGTYAPLGHAPDDKSEKGNEPESPAFDSDAETKDETGSPAYYIPEDWDKD